MTHASIRSRRLALVGFLAVGATIACADKSKHATDGDSGAAAPGTVIDMSATPRAGDSTTGVSAPTGQPGAAGDTVGSRARNPKARPGAGSPASRP